MASKPKLNYYSQFNTLFFQVSASLNISNGLYWGTVNNLRERVSSQLYLSAKIPPKAQRARNRSGNQDRRFDTPSLESELILAHSLATNLILVE